MDSPINNLTESSPQRRSFGEGGFTLVEVAISMGIAVFAVIGVLALLQIGLGNYRNALNSSVSSAVGQQVISTYLLAEFDTLAASTVKTAYYDERGVPLAASQAAAAVYVSEAQILPDTTLGMSKSNLLTLRVKVSSPTQPQFEKVFISHIARQGKATP